MTFWFFVFFMIDLLFFHLNLSKMAIACIIAMFIGFYPHIK